MLMGSAAQEAMKPCWQQASERTPMPATSLSATIRTPSRWPIAISQAQWWTPHISALRRSCCRSPTSTRRVDATMCNSYWWTVPGYPAFPGLRPGLTRTIRPPATSATAPHSTRVSSPKRRATGLTWWNDLYVWLSRLDTRPIAPNNGENQPDFLTSQQHLDTQVADGSEGDRHQNGHDWAKAALQRTPRDQESHSGRDRRHRHDSDDRAAGRLQDLSAL